MASVHNGQPTTKADLDGLHTFAAPGPRRAPGEAIPPRPSDSLDETLPEDFPMATAPNTTRLKARLLEMGYSQHDREAIVGYAVQVGTLEGCLEVDGEDRAELDAILEAAWPAVPLTSHAWDDLWATPRQVSVYDGSDLAGVVEEWGDRLDAAWTVARPERLAAIAEVAEVEILGGDEPTLDLDELIADAWDEPYEPTQEDLEAYRAMLAEAGDFDDLVGVEFPAYKLPETEPFLP